MSGLALLNANSPQTHESCYFLSNIVDGQNRARPRQDGQMTAQLAGRYATPDYGTQARQANCHHAKDPEDHGTDTSPRFCDHRFWG